MSHSSQKHIKLYVYLAAVSNSWRAKTFRTCLHQKRKLNLFGIQGMENNPVWNLTGDQAAHQGKLHLHTLHLLFTRLPFIIKDNFMDRFFNRWAILINHRSSRKQRNCKPAASNFLSVWLKSISRECCMQMKCGSKHKPHKGDSIVCKKSKSMKKHFGLSEYTGMLPQVILHFTLKRSLFL